MPSFEEDPDNVYILLERCKHQTLMEMVKSRGRLTQPVRVCFTTTLGRFQWFPS